MATASATPGDGRAAAAEGSTGSAGPNLCSSRPTRLSALILATLLVAGAVMWQTGENVVASTDEQSKAARPRPDLTRLPSTGPSQEALSLRDQMKGFLHNEIGGTPPAMFKDGTADLSHVRMAMNQKMVSFFMHSMPDKGDDGSASSSQVAGSSAGSDMDVPALLTVRMNAALTRMSFFDSESGGTKPAAVLVERLFRVMDGDADGVVSEAEYTAASRAIDKDPMAFAFAIVDGDGDKALSKAELRAVAAAAVSLGVDVYGQVLDASFEALTGVIPAVLKALPGEDDKMYDYEDLYRLLLPPLDRAGMAAAGQLYIMQAADPLTRLALQAVATRTERFAAVFKEHIAAEAAGAAGADQDMFGAALALAAGVNGDAETVDGAAEVKPEEARMVQGLMAAMQQMLLPNMGVPSSRGPDGAGSGHASSGAAGGAGASSGGHLRGSGSAAGAAAAVAPPPALGEFQLKVVRAMRAAEVEQFPVLADLLYFMFDRDGDALVSTAEVEVHTNLTRAFTAERMAALSPAQVKVEPIKVMQGAPMPPAAVRAGQDIVRETTRAIFALLDVNGDGYVTKDEAAIELDSLLKAVSGAASVAMNVVEVMLLDDKAGMLDPVLEAVMVLVDADKDGAVQLPEVLRILALLSGQMPGGPGGMPGGGGGGGAPVDSQSASADPGASGSMRRLLAPADASWARLALPSRMLGPVAAA